MIATILAVLDAHPHMTLAVLAVVTIAGAVIALSGTVVPVPPPRPPYRPMRFADTMRVRPGASPTALPEAYVVWPALWPVGAVEVHEMREGRVMARVSFNDMSDAVECALRLNASSTLSVVRPPWPKAPPMIGFSVGMLALM